MKTCSSNNIYTLVEGINFGTNDQEENNCKHNLYLGKAFADLTLKQYRIKVKLEIYVCHVFFIYLFIFECLFHITNIHGLETELFRAWLFCLIALTK